MRRALLFSLLLLILGASYLYLALYRPYQGFPEGGVYVDIPHGASQRTIARLLEQNGVVRSQLAFEWLCRARKRHTLEAGEYFFDHPATAFEVYDEIANGRVYVKQFVVPEGFTMFDIAESCRKRRIPFTREDFLAAARDPSPIRDLAPDAPSLEGFLFPATYEFPRHMTGKDMTAAMVKKFRQEWIIVANRRTRPRPNRLQDVVTLASLVERETPRPEERPARCRRICQPPAHRPASAMRSDGRVRAHARGEIQRQTGRGRSPFSVSLQHLPEQRPAAGTYRQSGRSGAARGSRSAADRRSLLRR